MTIAAPAETRPQKPAAKDERRVIGVACGAHALHDGFTELIYVVLPIWQAEFGLPYAAVGLLRTIFSGTMASLQIPASLMAERLGGATVLAAGTALSGLCFVLAGLSADFFWLIAALLVGGLGASTQHPIGSALVARAFAGARSLNAIGIYNFSGDIGKVALPAAATALLLLMPWRPVVALLGGLGLAAAAAIFLLLPRLAADEAPVQVASDAADEPPAHSAPLRGGFVLLLVIGALDSITRLAFLVFLPFLMIAKGGTVATGGLALTLTFMGGAAGKLVYSRLARFGIVNTICVTKFWTAAGMLAILVLPIEATLVLLPIFGVALNGPTSLTYGSVPVLVAPTARTRAFSIFYTGTLGSGALAPTVAGLIGDIAGIPTTVTIIAALVLLTLPLAWMLRPALIAAGGDR
jgi:MFS family permease